MSQNVFVFSLPWTIESIEITPEQNNKEGNTSLLISTPALSTENGFSYSCGNAVFEFKNDNKGVYLSYSIYLY